MSTPAAELSEVTLRFAGNRPDDPEVTALDNVSLHVPPGEFLAIVGPSGCGKTTILNLLAGLLPATSGKVQRNGNPVRGPRRDVGYMLARAALSPWRTARRNVELGLEFRGVPRAQRREASRRLLRQVRLEDFANSYPAQLSQGMRQRVAIARTLAIDPDIWLMDEPFGALDAQTRLTVQEEFLGLWEGSGKTVIFVTHDLSEAVLLADRVEVMTARPGRIKFDIDIDLPRPRQIADLRFEPVFQEYEEQVWRELRDELI